MVFIALDLEFADFRFVQLSRNVMVFISSYATISIMIWEFNQFMQTCYVDILPLYKWLIVCEQLFVI